jgi:nuclear pore complex protein Nup155
VATIDEVLLCALVRVTEPVPITMNTPSSNALSVSMNGYTPTTTTTTTTPSSRRYGLEYEDMNTNTNASSTSTLQLIPTSFTLSTDTVRINSIAGSDDGRIFLGGDDGCLYEMTYELGTDAAFLVAYNDNEPSLHVTKQLEQFYDDDAIIPEVIVEEETSDLVQLGKRAWSTFKAAAILSTSLLDGPLPSYSEQQQQQRPRKCAKINRTANSPKIIKAIVPDFVVRGASFLFGGPTSAAGGKITQIIVDEHRGCIYTLSILGWICTFDLKYKHGGGSTSNSNSSTVLLSAVIDTPRTARLYLEAVSRGQGFPPSSTNVSNTIGHITFPGGGIAAQAGVGGMEGARTILKHEDINRQQSGSSNGNKSRPNVGSMLKPTSIHVIAPTESSRLTLLAVTEGGLRYYLSSLTPHVISNGADAVMAGRYGTRVVRNPLSPSNRITLCHIRAPPPTNDNQIRDQNYSSDPCGVVGGMTPRLSRSKMPSLVDAAFYKQGVFMIATADVDNNANPTTTASRQPVGDTIVATCPVSIARKLDVPIPSSTADRGKDCDTSKSVFVVVGGITESLSFPMPSLDGSQKLPGGIVWDIADISSDTRTVFDLVANSTTPSDNELSIGIPPPYYPPSKTKSDETFAPLTNIRSDFNGHSNPSMSTLVSVNAPISTTSFKVFGNVVANLLLSRPLQYGLSSDEPLKIGMNDVYNEQPNYRISNRISAKGFSGTAGEISVGSSQQTMQQHIHSRSARLRPWLLRPSTIPLNQIATHVYTKSHNLVALNAGGLHFFGSKNALTRLAEILVGATNNVTDDSTITQFFNGYGYKESCCMCYWMR